MSKRYDIECSLIVLYYQNKILLQHRTKDAKIMPDYWAFFGGGIKKGETPLEAVIRETKEELDYELKKPEFFLKKEFNIYGQSGKMYVYIQEYNGDRLILKEGQDLGWFDMDKIEKLKTIPHDKEVMKRVLKFCFDKKEICR